MVIGAVIGASLLRRPRLDPALEGFVKAEAESFRLSGDQKRTDVTGFIDNYNTVPVDVTVRVRGHDFDGNVVAEFESGPYRKVGPGKSLQIRASLDMYPVNSVSIDVVGVARSEP
jgi:hypothetical protein